MDSVLVLQSAKQSSLSVTTYDPLNPISVFLIADLGVCIKYGHQIKKLQLKTRKFLDVSCFVRKVNHYFEFYNGFTL